MARHYGSFLVRCWQVGAGERRIEIEHVQSGRRTCVAALAAAMDWMEAHCGAAPAVGGGEPKQAPMEEGR